MKRLLLIPLVLLYIGIVGQQTSDDKSGFDFISNTKIGLQLGYAHTVGLRHTPLDDGMDYYHRGRGSYTIGINARTVFSDVVGIQYGMENFKINMATISECSTCDDNYRTETFRNYTYYNVPLQFNYYFSEGRTDFYASAGISVGFYKAGKARIEAEGMKTQYLYNLQDRSNGFYSSALLGCGMNYNLRYNLSFGLDVNYQIGLTGISKEFNETPSFISIKPGIYYQL